ncbi:MAG: LacI family DNA-binding transcriptional regulator [Enterobacter cloacae]|nr:LacI family DNA-binding transcriptional regulator [Enterobacter cloacae]
MPGPKDRVTIEDVAARAGVSIATVMTRSSKSNFSL